MGHFAAKRRILLRRDRHWGQFIFVFPKQRMVIVRTARNWGLDPTSWPQVVEYIADHAGASKSNR